MIPGTSTDKVRETRWKVFRKPLAIITSFFLIVSTVVLSAPDTAEQSYGARGGTVNGSWQIGAVTQVFGSYTTGSGLPAVNDQLLYGVQLSNMWSWALSADGSSGNLSQIASGAGNSGIERSTLAIDGHREDRGEGKNVYYFWPWAGSTILRAEEGSNVADRLTVPSPTDTSPGSLTGWSGGEVIQKTGEIFFSGQEATYLSTSANCNDTAAASHFAMMVLDPNDLTYRASGRICPKNTSDSLNGIVASDMALDGNGNAYIVVQEAAANTHTLMRVVPAPKDDPTQKWTYNRVKSNIVTETSLSVWGMAFVNGRLYMGRETAATNFAVINPLTGTSQRFTGDVGVNTYTFDFASAQTAFVVDGYVYNDLNADGEIQANEPGLEGATVAIYRKTGNNYTLEGSLTTDESGSYSALLGGKGEYIFRVVQPQIDGINAVQTWASGEELVDKKGEINSTTPVCWNVGPISGEYTGKCYGAVEMPAPDKPLGGIGSTVTEQQVSEFMIYQRASVQSVYDVAEADFGVTAMGSFGDLGPKSGNQMPYHINGVAIDAPVWLGNQLGSYSGPGATYTAHATDDGMSWAYQCPAGGDCSEGTALNDQMFATGREYMLQAELSGDHNNLAEVKGWTATSTSSPLGESPAWNNTAAWTPDGSGAIRTAPITFNQAGYTGLRVNVSPDGTTINAPVNQNNQYYDSARAGTVAWATYGEIEDYQFRVVDHVVRPALKTSGGTGSATISSPTGTDSCSRTLSANGGPKLGSPCVGKAGTYTVSQVASGFDVISVTARDSFNNNEIPGLVSGFTATATGATFTYTPQGTGTDVILEVLIAKKPDPAKSSIELVTPGGVMAGTTQDATATVVEGDGNPLAGVVVTFISSSNDVKLCPEDEAVKDGSTCVVSETPCTTDDKGQCSISLYSTVPGTYNNAIQATAVISGTPTKLGTPQPAGQALSPKWEQGSVDQRLSVFSVSPTANPDDGGKTNWQMVKTTSDPGGSYTAQVVLKDELGNPVSGMDPSSIVFATNSSPDATCTTAVETSTAGTYTSQCTSTMAYKGITANVKVGGNNITTTPDTVFSDPGAVVNLPIPFKAGAPAKTCTPTAKQCTSLMVDPRDGDTAPYKSSLGMGGTATATALVTDENGNPVENTTVYFSVDKTDVALVSAPSASTNENGEATVTISGQKADTTNLAAKVNFTGQQEDITNSPWPISFAPGTDPDPDKSSFSVEPCTGLTATTVKANDTDCWKGIMLAKDEQGNIIKNATGADMANYTWVVPDNGYVKKSGVLESDGEGNYWYTYTSKVADDFPVSLLYKPKTQTVNSAQTIKFVPGDPAVECTDATMSGRTGSDLTPATQNVGVGGQGTVSAKVTDEFCNPIEGATVAFTLGAGTSASFVGNASVMTNADGIAEVKVTDNVAETAKVSGSSGTMNFGGKAVDVVFTAGEPTNSTWTVAECTTPNRTPGKVAADGSECWKATVTPKDAGGNLVTLTPEQMAKYTYGVTPTGVTVSGMTSNGDGTYSLTYVSTVSGDFKATAKYDNSALTEEKEQFDITFWAGAMDPRYSSLSVDPTTAAAGTMVTVKVVAKDQYQNPIIGLNQDDIKVAGYAQGSGPDLTVAGFQTLPNGEYIFKDTTSQSVATYELNGTVGGVALTQRPTVNFTAGAPSTKTSYLQIIENDRLANGTEQNVVRAYANDEFNNPVPGAIVYVRDTTTGATAGYLRPNTPQDVTTNAQGYVDLYYTATMDGYYRLDGFIGGRTEQFRPEGSKGMISDLYFSEIGTNHEKATLTVDKTSPQTVGTDYVLTATVVNDIDQPQAGKRVAFSLNPNDKATLSADACETGANGTCQVRVSSTQVETVTVSATLGGGQLGGNGKGAEYASPKTLAWTAGTMCLGGATCKTRAEVIDDGAVVATGENRIVFYAFDSYDNPLPGLTVSTERVGAGNLTIDSAPGQIDSQGSLTVKYRSTQAGAHNVTAKIDGKDVPVYNYPLKYPGTPSTTGTATINFIAAPAGETNLEISPSTPQPVASNFTVTATVKDMYGNPVSGPVTFLPVNDLTYVGGNSSCTTSASTGTCSVQVTTTKAGSYDIVATYGGSNLAGSPVTAEFTAGSVCTSGPNCKTKVEVTLDGALADGSQQNVATVTVSDSYGNPIQGAVITSTSQSPLMTVQPSSGTQMIQPTDSSGTTTIWYTSNDDGAFRADVRINGSTTPPGSPITLTFVPDKVSARNSSYTVTPAGPLVVGTDMASMYTVTATVKGENNVPVKGAIVEFQLTSDDPVMSGGGKCTTSAAAAALGTCSITIHSTVSGSFTLTATVLENNSPTRIINSGTMNLETPLTWSADEACVQGCTPITRDPEKWSRISVTKNNALADDSDRDIVTVKVFDKYGNPAMAVVSTTAAAEMTAQSNIAALDEKGETTIWYTSGVAGTHSASVTVDGKGITGSPASLTFVPGEECVGPECPEYCTDGRPGSRIEGMAGYKELTTATVGTQTQIKALVTDKDCNPIPGKVVTFSHDSDTAAYTPANAQATTGTDGWAIVTLTDKTAQIVENEGTVNGKKIFWGSPAKVEFTAKTECMEGDPKCPKFCADGRQGTTIWGDELDKLTTRKANEPAEVNALITDEFCNPLKGKTVVFSHDSSDATIAPTSAVTGDDGKVKVTLNDKKAETVKVDGSVGSAKIVNGAPAEFKFTSTGRPTDKCTLPNGQPGRGSDITANPLSAGVGGTSEITAYVTDEFCNPIEGASVTFSASGSATFVPATPTTKVTGADGNAKITITDDVAEVVDNTAIVARDDGPMPITTGSPAKVEFLAGAPDPDKSTFKVEKCTGNRGAPDVIADGVDCWQGILGAFDSLNNPLPNLPANQLNLFQWNADAKVTKSAVVDNNDGTYTMKYTSETADTEFIVNVMFNGAPAKKVGKDETIIFVPDAPCVEGAPKCPLKCADGRDGTNLKVAPVTLPVDDTAAVTVLITDAKCNPVKNYPVSLTVTGDAVLGVTNADTDNNGKVETTLNDLTAETVKVHASAAGGTVPEDTNVTFTVGALDPRMSDFIVYKTAGNNSPDKVRADGTESWTGELIPKDKGGNIITTPLTNAQIAMFVPNVDSTVTATRNPGPGYTWKFTSNTHDKSTDVSLHHDNSRIPHDEHLISFTRAVPPVIPTITEPTPGAEVATQTPRIAGANGEPGASVTVRDGDTVICTTTVQADGTWSCTPTTPLAEGPHSVTVTSTDSEGNESDRSAPVNFNVDVTPPDAPRITEPVDGAATNNTKPRIAGENGEPGSTITVKDQDGNVLCTTTAAANGSWNCTPSTPLDDGDYDLTVTATDAAGNESEPSAPIKVTIDTVKPDAPVIETPTPGQAVPTARPEFAGKGDKPGSTITVKDDKGNVICTAEVQADKSWSCTPSKDLPEGNYNINAIETDKAGNVSDPSDSIPMRVKTTPPAKPGVNKPDKPFGIDEDVTLTGTGEEEGNEIIIRDDKGNEVCKTTVQKDLSWSCTLPDGLTEGEHTLAVVEKDAAGNESDPTLVDVEAILTPPMTPVVDPTNGSKVTGKADPDSKVTVTDKDGNPVPGCEDITPDATGRFECVPDVKLNPGDSITVVATDRAGNKSKPVTVKIGALGIEVAHPKRYHGEEQIVSGKNFNPGENVSLVIYSDPFEVGTAVADKDGKVTFKFAVPETLEYGQHTATLTGEESGDASTTFEVIAKPVVPTGGTTIPGSSLPLMLMAMGALMAFVGFQVFPRIQRNK